MVRAKFKLTQVTERIQSRAQYDDPENPKKVTGYKDGPLWDAEFNVVMGGTSDENQTFWEYTPSGKLSLATIKVMPWTIGKEYYLDISEAI